MRFLVYEASARAAAQRRVELDDEVSDRDPMTRNPCARSDVDTGTGRVTLHLRSALLVGLLVTSQSQESPTRQALPWLSLQAGQRSRTAVLIAVTEPGELIRAGDQVRSA